LADLNVQNFQVVELNEMGQEGKCLSAELRALTGRSSVPNCFIAGKNVGGLNDGTPGLLPLHRAGQLVPLLKDAGAFNQE